jgi:AraC-like DNA-binding protein
MNPVDDVLTTMRPADSRYLKVAARAPWGIAFRPGDAALLVLIASGSCWLVTGTVGEPQRLSANDCFLVRPGTGFTLQDEPGRPTLDFDTIVTGIVVGHGGDGELTEIVSGRLAFDTSAAEPLFGQLPPLFRLDLDAASGEAMRATFGLLGRETADGGIGCRLITSKLADVLFLQAMRAYCMSVDGDTISWLGALRDPQLAAAMHALHNDLARPWTVDALAREAGMSRSAFAAAFRAKAGETPLGYLTEWRMYRAKSLLRDTPLSLQEIAVRVGYDSGAAFSRVFTRREGASPGAWRRSQ